MAVARPPLPRARCGNSIRAMHAQVKQRRRSIDERRRCFCFAPVRAGIYLDADARRPADRPA